MKDDEYLSQMNTEAANDTAAEAPAAPAPNVASGETTTPAAQTDYFTFHVGGKAQQIPSSAEWVIPHGGQLLKVPVSKIANQYRQFEHLQDKYKKFNEERSQWEQQRPVYENAKKFYDKYGQFQEWSEKNPQEWQRLWDLYQNKDKHLLESQVNELAQGQTTAPYAPFIDKISSLEKTVSQLMEDRNSWQAEQKRAQDEADVQEVKGEIEQFKKDYPEIKLDEQNPDGTPLWAEIVQFGVDRRIPDFESAALKFLKPRLSEVFQARGRNEATKTIKQDNRAGIVARSPTPFNKGQSTPVVNFKTSSYGDLGRIAEQEYARLTSQS